MIFQPLSASDKLWIASKINRMNASMTMAKKPETQKVILNIAHLSIGA